MNHIKRRPRNLLIKFFRLMVACSTLMSMVGPALVSAATQTTAIEPAPMSASATRLLPAWYEPVAPASTARDLLPSWFSPASEQPASADPRPATRSLTREIPQGDLTVDVTGPEAASVGAPAGAGEVYTAVIRNDSDTDVAYGIYLTATHESFMIYDGGDSLISSTGAITPLTVVDTSNAITWTLPTTYNLGSNEAITLNFKLRATCGAQSGQRLAVGVNYNADPDEPPIETNASALNVTTGRGNLVVNKYPALQELGTGDFGTPITWTVEVQNTGLGKLYNATVTDTGGINLSQPTGDLTPSVTIDVLDINEIVTYTVVGTVEACNFTNVAEAAWPCGNIEGDGYYTNPVASTVSVLFTPNVPKVSLDVSDNIAFPYCATMSRTVTVTATDLGGAAGDLRIASNVDNVGFLEILTSTLSAGWMYDNTTGRFTYQDGTPAGTLLAGEAVTLSFQVQPDATVCSEGGGALTFTPLYRDICANEPFTGTGASLAYQHAEDEAPTLDVAKSGPSSVASGEVFTYDVMFSGYNPVNISGTIHVTDTLPPEFEFQGTPTPTLGTVVVNTNTGTLLWTVDSSALSDPFNETLPYSVRAITDTDGICGAGQQVDNAVEVFAQPTCDGCPDLNRTAQVQTIIENQEGIFPSGSAFGSFEVCGDQGFTITNRYEVTGSTVVTWANAVFTEALGTDIGGAGHLGSSVPLIYRDALSIVIDGVDYTAYVTETETGGPLVLDLGGLVSAGAPTQTFTLAFTYTVGISEASLDDAVEQTFYDWSQLYLPNSGTDDVCAGNDAFNQAIALTIRRGDLSVDLSPIELDRCETNRAVVHVRDNIAGTLTDHMVVTFTSSSEEIGTARNFATTGNLPGINEITRTIDIDQGIITFTFPADYDPTGDGIIEFDLDVGCTEEAVWRAGITYQSRCDFSHEDATDLTHTYRKPGLILFATPIEYTLREREPTWKFFVANNGNLTATNVLVTNTVQGMDVFTFTADGPDISAVLSSDPVVFTIGEIAPGQQRAVTVTAEAFSCTALDVDIAAQLDCFGTVCGLRQEEIDFNRPQPYLRTNNGQTADLPMCDLGEVVFTTKNASPDVNLYRVDITETLEQLVPAPGEPFTVTVLDADENAVATTTAFNPLSTTTTAPNAVTSTLVWEADRATTDVITWFQELPPLYIIRIHVPVRTSCVAPYAPTGRAAATAEEPCGERFSRTENAVTFQTLEPNLNVEKDGRVVGGEWDETVYATPGQTVTWRLLVENPSGFRAYKAENVVLSDTWPVYFDFITATTAYSPHLQPASRTITWDVGDVALDENLYFYITGTVVTTDPTACSGQTVNNARLYFGCADGCTYEETPQDSANLDSVPNLSVDITPGPFSICEGDVELTISNEGARAYTNTLTVTLPGGYAAYTYTVDGPAPDAVTGLNSSVLQFYWDELPGRTTSAPYTFTTTLGIQNSGTSGACPGITPETVTAALGYDDAAECTTSGPYAYNTTASLNVGEPDLVVTKAPAYQTVDAGETVTWTLTVQNVGDAAATNVVVTDVAGSNYEELTATVGSDGAVPTVSGNTITWALTSDIAASGGTWSAQVSAVLSNTGVNRNIVTATAFCDTGCASATSSDVARTTLLQAFVKGPEIQTGTIGSLAVFTFATTLPDRDALYEELTLTDTLPPGLGYVSAVLTYTYDGDGNDGGPVGPTSIPPTNSPGYLASDDVIWALGDLPGTVQINGVITTVIQDVDTNYEGVRLTNELEMTYVDDGVPYVNTDTVDVDVVEPILHLGKTYVTPRGCEATLLADNFNDGNVTGWDFDSGWSVTPGGLLMQSGNNQHRYAFAGQTSWTDYSFSTMMRSDDDDIMSLLFRVQDSNTFYRFSWALTQGGPYQRLERLVGGISQLLVERNEGYIEGRWYHVEVQTEENHLRVFVDGVLILEHEDTSAQALRSGRIGFHTHWEDPAYFDDVLVTRLEEAACPVGANDPVTYTLTISNQGRFNGHDLVVTDTIPDGTSLLTYTFESDDPETITTAQPAPIPGASGVLTWGFNQLVPSDPFTPLDHTAITMTVVLTVADGITANTFLPNQAVLTYDAWITDTQQITEVVRDYSGGSHSAAVRTVDGGIVKATQFSPPPTATLGSLVTYTLIVPASPISATLYDVVVTDTIDSRFYIEDVTTSGGTGPASAWDAQTLTATFASIPHSTQAFITVTARISHEWPSPAGDANAGDIITNSAIMTHATAEELTRTNTVSTEVGEPDVSVVKSVASSAVTTDLDGTALLTYTLRLENTGNSQAYSLHITDAVPSGISVTAQYGGDERSGPVVGADTLTWTVDYLSNTSPANATLLTYTARITQALSDAALENVVDLLYHSLTETIPGVRPYTDTDQADVETAPPSVVKATAPVTLRVGDVTTYTLVFTVPAGTVGMGSDSYLEDTLPAGVWAISGTEALTWTPSAVEPITFTDRATGTVGASEVVTWTFGEPITSTQDAPTVITLTFQAQATGEDADGNEVWSPYDVVHSITNIVALTQRSVFIDDDDATNDVIQPDLSIVKAATPPDGSVVARGETITYTLTVANAGHGPAYDVVVTDTLPVGIDYVRVISAPNPASATITETRAGQALTYTASELAAGPGAAMVITVVGHVTDTIAANLALTNTAAVPTYDSQPDDGPGPRTPTQRVYTDGVDSVVHRTTDAALIKTVTPLAATLGDVITYTIDVPEPPISATLYGVTVTDALDTRLQLHTVNAPGGSTVTAGNAFTVTYADIISLTQRTITVTAVVSDPLLAYAGDVITNVAVLRHSTDVTTSNEVDTTVVEPLVSVAKTGSVLTGDPQRALYTLTVANSGTSPAYSLIVTDALPAGLAALSISDGGTPSPDGRTLTWTFPFLSVGDTQQLTYTARLTEAIYTHDRFTNTVDVRNTSLTETIPGVREYLTETDHTLPWPLGRLGDYVWYDFDYDGVQNTITNEFGIGGVVIDLFDSDTGAYITSTTTAPDGSYIFDYLPLDVTYTVRISETSYAPGGPLAPYSQTLWMADGSTLANDSNASITQTFDGLPYAITTTLTPAVTEDLTLDYGFVELVELGNYVWFDIDRDGVQGTDDGEVGIDGVTVILTYPDGRVFTTTTTPTGYYTFTVPVSQTYTVTVIADNFAPGGPLETMTDTLSNVGDDALDSDGTPVGDAVLTVTPVITENNYTFDFGFWQPMALGNYVWFDTDDSGVVDAGEVGVPGVDVELYQDSDGSGDFTPGDAFIDTTTTDATGHYTFTDLLPSLAPTQTYLLVITETNFTPGGALENYLNSTAVYTGNSDLNDHDHGVVSGTLGSGGVVASTPVSLTVGAEPDDTPVPDGNTNLSLDFGFYQLSLGDQVWYDDNNNGLIDGGESGADNITVNLYDVTGTTLLDTTTTDVSGFYTFTNLLSGTGYVVEIEPPATYTSSTDIASSDDPLNNVNSDDNGVIWDGGNIRSQPITLTAGYTGTLNNNDVDNAAGTIHDPTVDFGLVQYLSLGNYVWFDTNNDGVTDTTEVGVPGVAVELYYDSDGSGDFTPGVDQVISTTTTDATGHYTFTELLPSRSATETYLVVITETNFAPGGPLENYQNSDGYVDGNSDRNDHDHGVVSGTLGSGGLVASTPVSLTVGDEPDGSPVPDGDSDANSNLTLDFGFYQLSLGDQVWYDDDEDGFFDVGVEDGVPDVEVRLYDITGTLVMTTTTDADGRYTFTHLLSDTYVVEIVAPQAYTSTTDVISSTNPNNNVDHDDNGVVLDSGNVIRSQPITLVPGDDGAQNENTVDDPTGSTYDPTVDFGLLARQPAVVKLVSPATATLGDTVVFTVTVPPFDVLLVDAVVTDTFDARLRPDDCRAVGTGDPPITCGISGQQVTGTWGSIFTNTTAALVITTTLQDLPTATAGAQITNTARFNWAGDRPTETLPVTVTVEEPDVDLNKSVQTPRDPVGAGDLVTYTLTLSNSGTWPAYDLVITDSLPTGLTFVATEAFNVSDPSTATTGGDYPMWTVSQLNVGGAVELTFTARVAADITASVTLTNTAWGAYDSQPGEPADERDYDVPPDTVPIETGAPALLLEKRAAPELVNAGEQLTYTLTVVNSGIVSATNVIITDTIPQHTRFADATGAYTGPTPDANPGSVVTWDLGTLDIGVPQSVTLVVDVDSPLPNGLVITNTAWLTSSEGLTDTDTTTSTVQSDHAITLTKTVYPAAVRPGGTLTYTLAYTVTGDGIAHDVTLSDTVPANTVFDACNGCTQVGDRLTWSLGDLAPLYTGSVTFTVVVTTPLPDGTVLRNTALLTDTDLTDGDEITTPVVSDHTLDVAKAVTPDVVAPDGLITYTLAYTVTGDEPVTGVTLSDTIPAHTTFYTATPTASSDPGVGNVGAITWDLGDFLPATSGITQATGSVTLVVRADTPLTDGLTLANTVLITDTDGESDSDTVTNTVESRHAITLTKSVDAVSATPGELLTYTLAYTITGDGIAPDVTLSDTVPANTTFWSAAPTTPDAPPQGGTGPVIWHLGSIEPPMTGTTTLVVRVDGALVSGTQIVNVGLITDTQDITDTDTVTTPVGSSHALSVSKSATPTFAVPGAPLTYTINWAVTGNEPAFDVTLSDTLPTSTTFQACSGAPCGESGGVITWSLGTQIPPAAGAVTLVVDVDPAVPTWSVLRNRVLISDSTHLTDTDDVETPTEARADLAITKIDQPDPVLPGATLTYTLLYTNYGPSDATDVWISDWLPDEVIFGGATPSEDFGPNPLEWHIASIPAGGGGTIVVTGTVQSWVTETFTNVVDIFTETVLEPDYDNNNDEEPTEPLVPNLEIVKTVLPGAAVPHMPFTYVIAITNTGQVTFDSVTLTDTLPTELNYVTGSGDPADPDVVAAPLLVWQDLGGLAPGDRLTVSFAVTVTPEITIGTYWNTALVEGEYPTGVITDTDDVPISIQDPAVALEKRLVGFDTDTVAPNYVTFTIAITNVGVSEIDVLPVYDLYDADDLHFAQAFPAEPDTLDNVGGQIVWLDLTGPTPHGFGRNMLPGEVFSLTTVFTIMQDITQTTNTAMVQDVEDIYDNPANEEDDSVDIVDVPTAIELIYFRPGDVSEKTVRLEWATAVEIDNFGFNLYRAPVREQTRASLVTFVPSRIKDGTGASYVYTDTVPSEGVWWYWLADVDTADRETFHGPIDVNVQASGFSHTIYLPLMLRGK